MCSTTTEKRPAAEARVHPIQPNQAGGPGTGSTPGGPSGPPAFDGQSEHVPDVTFIVRPRVNPDGFLDPARRLHEVCGLNPGQITSVENLLVQLAASSARIPRLRIVSHSHPQALAMAMFESSDVFQVNQEWLVGFAESNAAGLKSILDIRSHIFSPLTGVIRSHIRNTNAALLTPFGANPPPAFDEFLRFSADIALVNLGLVTRGGAALNATRRNTLIAVLTFLGNDVGAPLITAGATQGNLDAVRAFVSAMTLNDFHRVGDHWDFPTGDFDQFAVAARALVAVQGGFRANLEAARRRLDENSFIDIRGCRAGESEEYPAALQAFFGRAGHLATISAARHFQFMGSCPFDRPANNGAIRTLLTTGANAQEIRDGFDDWLRRTHVDPLHKDFWHNLMNGNAVAFCGLAWRTGIPRLNAQFSTPGLANFGTLTFLDTITRIVDLFRVAPASVPSGSVLATLNTFVGGQLAGWAPTLLAVVNTTTPAAQLPPLFTQLQTINTALGQTLVPATAPSPLQATDISGYQIAIVGFLESHQLAPARQFMDAVKARIDDTTDPGLRYYVLQIGMPVYVFARNEQALTGHRVQVTHNRLVVFAGATEDEAYRQWVRLQWAEPLPSGAQILTMHPGDADALHLQMMVESPDPGPTSVAVCPHPNYFDRMRILRGTR